MTIEQIEYEISKLSEKIDLIDNNVKFNLQMFWGVVAIIVAILGMSIYFLVKQYIKSTLDSQLENQINNVKETLLKELKNEDFIIELPIMNCWKSIQPIIMHKNSEGYIKINGAVIFDGEKTGRYNIILAIPYGFRPAEELKFFVMNGEVNGECKISKDGLMELKRGSTDNIIQFNIMYKKENVK